MKPVDSRAMLARVHTLARVCALAFSLAGCAVTARLPDLPATGDLSDIHHLIRLHAAQDARFQVITDRPFLQVDLRHRYAVPGLQALPDFAARQVFVTRYLADAGALADRSVTLALARIPAEALADFAARHGLAGTGDAVRLTVRNAVLKDQHSRLAAEQDKVATFRSNAEIDHYWRELLGHIESSIMSRGKFARRLLTAPAVPFISAWISYHNHFDYRGPSVPAFKKSIELSPVLDTVAPAGIAPADWTLLQRHAPVIVQEVLDNAPYSPTYDHFGRVSLIESTDDVVPSVDAAQPTLYAFIDSKVIQGHNVRQLVYTLWYPWHPAHKRFDPEAGPLDGWTVRVTLDAQARPVVVESVSNCGCYYKIFPGQGLEVRAAATFGAPLDGKTYHLEQHHAGRVDAVVPEAVAGLDGSAQNIVLYLSAGHHQLVSVRTQSTRVGAVTHSDHYELRAYEELERLPAHGIELGLFGQDGLVRGADRGECNLLSPSGLYHAGHPRQRETQMVYFDEADFDDPHLLEQYLRLPPDAFAGRW